MDLVVYYFLYQDRKKCISIQYFSFQIQSDDPDLDIQDEFSVLFGFEFERTFKTERKIHVEFLTRSYSKDVVVEQGIFNEYAKSFT